MVPQSALLDTAPNAATYTACCGNTVRNHISFQHLLVHRGHRQR